MKYKYRKIYYIVSRIIQIILIIAMFVALLTNCNPKFMFNLITT